MKQHQKPSNIILVNLVSTFLLLAISFDVFAQGQLGTQSGGSSGLQISSDFPGGSAKVESLDAATQTVQITPAGDPDRGWPCWWYFRLNGVDTSKPVVLEVIGNESLEPTDKPGQRKKLSALWSLPMQASFSTDGVTWEHTEKGARQGNEMTYYISTTSPTLWLAWGPPFTLDDANKLVQSACKQCPYATSFELAKSTHGRSVPGLRISEPGAAGAKRFSVWVQSRTHAWESGASWVTRGFVDWLVSNDSAAEDLRQKADIVIIPIMDVDSVEAGQGGKNQVPHDHNRDWGDNPHWPEVRAAMERLNSLIHAGHLDLFLDLHNSGPGNRTISIYIPAKPLLTQVRIENENTFMTIMREQITGSISFIGTLGPDGDTYDPAVDKSCDSWVAHLTKPDVVSLTFETPWNTPGSTQTGYLKVGEQMGRCLDQYLEPIP